MTASQTLARYPQDPYAAVDFRTVTREWCLENQQDPETSFYDLPADARTEIKRRVIGASK